MKIKVPIEVDVNLNRTELMYFIKQWIYPILKEYKLKGSDWANSKAIVKDNSLYWEYSPTMGEQKGQTLLEPINIQDEKVFNVCKSAVELLNAYSEIKSKSKYSKIN